MTRLEVRLNVQLNVRLEGRSIGTASVRSAKGNGGDHAPVSLSASDEGVARSYTEEEQRSQNPPGTMSFILYSGGVASDAKTGRQMTCSCRLAQRPKMNSQRDTLIVKT